MKNTMIFAACALLLAGCGSTAVRDSLAIQDPTVLQRGFDTEQSVAAGAAVRQWTDVYGQIKAPRDVTASLESRLAALGQKKENYYGYKDQCWIDAANEEIRLQNRWGFVEEAVGEAARLTAGLEGSQPVSRDNPPLRTVAPVRPDLAASVRALENDSRFQYCPAAQKVAACMEVKLIHAGHDAWARNFDASRRKVIAVEEAMTEAQQHLATCGVPQAPPPVAPPPPPPPLPPMVTLSTDALFLFDRGDIAAITDGGRSKLDAVIDDLKRAGEVTSVSIAGYTDRLGSAAYNRALSQRRSTSVQRYLQSRGIKVPIQARGHGPASPGAQCTMKNHSALVECLAGDRRVELRFSRKGEPIDSDE
ncbi:OmpA/MotB family outer membrane protein [Caballeronia terrestris]|uniref:OmpA/MotB family outer membrane protein n=1 Tax=Caballeronia terrestris TaxID=1226301 RepID=A0A158I4D4_9BURK|nr:OmpA family protein [Caballeronia terrestris]SAL51475.1 OmpA/MotB family outer membrane protein [Caballeronia terrestris]